MFRQDDMRLSWVRVNGTWVPVNSKEWVWSEAERQWVPQKLDGWEWNERTRMWEAR